MDFKPDYGLSLKNDGLAVSATINILDFHMFNLTILGPGKYSTLSETYKDGELHAASLDFSQVHLEKILSLCDAKIAANLRNEIKKDPFSPRYISFEGVIRFNVRAKLGELEENENESFIPLKVRKISSTIDE